MRNPFQYGEVVSGQAFTGRQRQLAALIDDMRQGQNVVIAAPRRYGKTSLVLEAVRAARAEGILVAYVDLFRTPTRERFASRLATELYAISAPTERLLRQAGDFFRSLPIRPKMTLGDDGKPEVELGAGADPRDVDRVIEALLELPAAVAERRKRRVVLVLDEFQEVVALDPNLPAVMRAVFQHQTEVAHIFLGSQQHLMRQVFTDRNQPMYRLARSMPLPPLGRDELVPFIEGQLARTGMTITTDALDRILATTGGHPHDTQQLCHFAWSVARAGGASLVDLSTVEEAIGEILEAESARFADMWQGLGGPQRAVLAALARTDGKGVFAEEYRRAHGLGSASSVQSALKRLIDRQIVEAAPRGVYRIADVFLRAWVARL